MSRLARRLVTHRFAARRAPWIAAALAAVAVFSWWPSRPAEGAGVGGYSEVESLEIAYRVADDLVEARFHLASGIALTQTVEDADDIDRLLQMATALAGGKAKMYATAQDDQIKTWHLTVP